MKVANQECHSWWQVALKMNVAANVLLIDYPFYFGGV
jgi:hypothetical protein